MAGSAASETFPGEAGRSFSGRFSPLPASSINSIRLASNGRLLVHLGITRNAYIRTTERRINDPLQSFEINVGKSVKPAKQDVEAWLST